MAARALLSNAVVVTALIATLTLLALNLSGPPGAPGTLNGYGYKDIVRTEEIARLLRTIRHGDLVPAYHLDFCGVFASAFGTERDVLADA